MKKVIIILSCIVLVALVGVGIYFGLNKNVGVIGGADGPTSIIIADDEKFDRIVSDILLDSKGKYLDGELSAEGHIILGKEENGYETTLYVLSVYGEYGFQDNNFVKTSGSGEIPVVIKCFENAEGVNLTTVIWPKDGAEYEESIKNMFPEKFHDRVLSIKKEDSKVLKEMEKEYAKTYLNQIGRTAKIGEYGDFEHQLLTQSGVTVEVSNKLLEKNYSDYPMWIGNQEKLEDGIRYVYQMDYDKDKNQIILSKSNYETKEVVEKILINSLTGEEI